MPEGLRKGQGDYDCACLEWFRDMVAFGMNLKGQSFWPASIWNAKAILESIALSKFCVSWRNGCVRCLQLQVTESQVKMVLTMRGVYYLTRQEWR